MHKAVIGSQYGDEGKGLMVDYLASQDSSALVVRSNGGAQAGHTVQTPDGRRHVFHHVGSGTFAGARTHLSRYMIVNPIVFNQEIRDLAALGETPVVSVDPYALVTTPFDMLINQMVETHRGDARHGSCGLGIGETIERSENDFELYAKDLTYLTTSGLINIRKEYAAERLEKLGLTTDTSKIKDYLEYFNDARVIEAYLQDVNMFLSNITFRDDVDLGKENLIFEGAQGLLLDQEFGEFPYVTRSNTGLKNIEDMITSMVTSRQLDVYYMTRAYQTRHGAGPMAREGDISEFFDAVDPTNVPNNWQGALRFGYLDIDQLMNVIDDDLSSVSFIDVHFKGVLTCLDQVRNLKAGIPVFDKTGLNMLTSDEIMQFFNSSMTSWGPTRSTIKS